MPSVAEMHVRFPALRVEDAFKTALPSNCPAAQAMSRIFYDCTNDASERSFALSTVSNIIKWIGCGASRLFFAWKTFSPPFPSFPHRGPLYLDLFRVLDNGTLDVHLALACLCFQQCEQRLKALALFIHVVVAIVMASLDTRYAMRLKPSPYVGADPRASEQRFNTGSDSLCRKVCNFLPCIDRPAAQRRRRKVSLATVS